MATQLESTGSLQRRLTLAVPQADITKEVADRLRRLARTVKMPGFRPGKVPMKLIEQSYGPSVHAEVLGDAVSAAFGKAADEHNLRVAGQPQIEPHTEAADGELGFRAMFEVYPDVVLGDVKTLCVERANCSVSDADIDKTLDVLRKQRVNWEPASRAAQDEDRVTIDFKGMLDGEAFDGGSAEDFPVVLGQGRMLPDFEAGIRGASTGETKTFPVAFPENYGAEKLSGKTAEFTITVKSVEQPVLPPLDDAFAKSLGVADGNLETMRADVRTNLEREVAQRIRTRNKASVMDALPGIASFDLPAALVEGDSADLAQRAVEDLKARGIDPKNVPIPPDAFKEQAEKRVRLGLLVAELVKEHDLKAKPDQIRKQIEDFAQSYENPAEVIRYYFSDRSRLAEVEGLVIEQNVVDWVLANAQVTDRTLGLDELMANN